MAVIIGKTDCRPEETGFDSSRIDKLNERLEDMISRRIIHGAAYCISHKGRIIAYAAAGKGCRTQDDIPMQPDTVFDAASLTKVFTATAVMQLSEDGMLNINDPVSTVLPQFRQKPFSDIRIIHLLTHTSGLYPDGGCFSESAPKTSWDLIEEASKLHKDADWIAAGISAGLRRPVGSEWMYCSFGFALLGEIVSRVSGMDAFSAELSETGSGSYRTARSRSTTGWARFARTFPRSSTESPSCGTALTISRTGS